MEHQIGQLNGDARPSRYWLRKVAKQIRWVRDELGNELTPAQELAVFELREVLTAICALKGRQTVNRRLVAGRSAALALANRRIRQIYAFLGLNAAGRKW